MDRRMARNRERTRQQADPIGRCFCGFADEPKGPLVFDTPEKIQAYRLLTLRKCLGFEIRGLRMSSKVNCYALIKREFGLRGNKQNVYDQFTSMLRQMGILQDLPQ